MIPSIAQATMCQVSAEVRRSRQVVEFAVELEEEFIAGPLDLGCRGEER